MAQRVTGQLVKYGTVLNGWIYRKVINFTYQIYIKSKLFNHAFLSDVPQPVYIASLYRHSGYKSNLFPFADHLYALVNGFFWMLYDHNEDF